MASHTKSLQCFFPAVQVMMFVAKKKTSRSTGENNSFHDNHPHVNAVIYVPASILSTRLKLNHFIIIIT
jgi:hypothetical protein